MAVSEVLFSSETDMWSTPQALFDELDQEFRFTLDACAVPENAKCRTFFSPEQDGLKQEWIGNVWCNPPYGRQVTRWIRKASEAGGRNADVVVMLLYSRTDTKWFHEYIYNKPGVEIRFIKGRVKFGGGA